MSTSDDVASAEHLEVAYRHLRGPLMLDTRVSINPQSASGPDAPCGCTTWALGTISGVCRWRSRNTRTDGLEVQAPTSPGRRTAYLTRKRLVACSPVLTRMVSTSDEDWMV